MFRILRVSIPIFCLLLFLALILPQSLKADDRDIQLVDLEVEPEAFCPNNEHGTTIKAKVLIGEDEDLARLKVVIINPSGEKVIKLKQDVPLPKEIEDEPFEMDIALTWDGKDRFGNLLETKSRHNNYMPIYTKYWQ